MIPLSHGHSYFFPQRCGRQFFFDIAGNLLYYTARYCLRAYSFKKLDWWKPKTWQLLYPLKMFILVQCPRFIRFAIRSSRFKCVKHTHTHPRLERGGNKNNIVANLQHEFSSMAHESYIYCWRPQYLFLFKYYQLFLIVFGNFFYPPPLTSLFSEVSSSIALVIAIKPTPNRIVWEYY